MNINADPHFVGWPTAAVMDYTTTEYPFCVLALDDTDEKQHQLFFQGVYLANVRLAAAAINGDLAELRRLLKLAELRRLLNAADAADCADDIADEDAREDKSRTGNLE